MKRGDLNRRTDRQDRRIRERIHDPYATQRKLSEPTVCPNCKAVFEAGRWSWSERPADAPAVECPACRRIADAYPAGELVLSGGFLAEHKDEIMHLIRNTEEKEKSEHPLHRIMAVIESADGVTVTTTDLHLPRRIGTALHNAYQGVFDIEQDPDGYFVRGRWHRVE